MREISPPLPKKEVTLLLIYSWFKLIVRLIVLVFLCSVLYLLIIPSVEVHILTGTPTSRILTTTTTPYDWIWQFFLTSVYRNQIDETYVS